MALNHARIATNEMAPAGTNPKIEELRFKVKTDPKSRLFYPLAEELRKIGQFGEAEQVLRAGLSTHATYLSAWVVLGRVLREQQKHAEAVEALTKALDLDRGNVVAARLLAEAYLNLGEKVEALKKYKLVHALLPGDDDVEAMIHRLEGEVSPAAASIALAEPPDEDAFASTAPSPAVASPPVADDGEAAASADQDDVFDNTYSGLKRQAEVEFATGDAEPMTAEHSESPFEESGSDAGYSADAFEVEQPQGIHLASAPMDAELDAPIPSFDLPAENAPPPADEQESEDDGFEPADGVAPGFVTGSFGANVPPPPAAADDFAKTIIMADLYANQGLVDEARDIYEDILARDPDNEAVRAKLEALDSQASGLGPQAAGEDEDPWSSAPVAASGRFSEEESSAFSPEARGLRPEASEEDPWASPPAAPGAQFSEEESAAVSPEARGLRPEASGEASEGKVRKLEDWLSRVKRSGAEGV